jgi:hypothetical protein
MSNQEYKNLEEFYPFYLSQHLNPICRKLHIYGTTVGLMIAVALMLKGYLWGLLLGLSIGYGCSWLGHFVFEKNKPATFQYPLMSLTCDFLMIKDFYLGTLDEKLAQIRS